jgi:hypothetical protein
MGLADEDDEGGDFGEAGADVGRGGARLAAAVGVAALDALDSHAATPDDPDRKVPNPARKAAAAQARHAEVLAAAAQAQRDASLAALRNRHPASRSPPPTR